MSQLQYILTWISLCVMVLNPDSYLESLWFEFRLEDRLFHLRRYVALCSSCNISRFLIFLFFKSYVYKYALKLSRLLDAVKSCPATSRVRMALWRHSSSRSLDYNSMLIWLIAQEGSIACDLDNPYRIEMLRGC
jgi:hypothetical protein